MAKCVGIENKPCGFEFDPSLEFPDDTLCDECFDELSEKVMNKCSCSWNCTCGVVDLLHIAKRGR